MNTATTPRVRTIPEVTRELGTIEGSNRSEKSPRFTPTPMPLFIM